MLIHKLLIALIFLLAFFLRIFRIEAVPARMTHDEMSIGYNAYSILKTGRDEWGRFLPLDFEAFGDHKFPAYIYATVPFVALFDLNILSTRIVSIISGVLLVAVGYFLVKILYQDIKLAYLAAFIIAINPWPVHLSRMALESNLALLLFYAGILAFLKVKQKAQAKYIVLSSLFLSLSMYSYVSYRVLVPLFILAVLIYQFWQKKVAPYAIKWLLFLIIFTLPLTGQFFGESGTARFNAVSIFSDPGIAMSIDEKRAFVFLTTENIADNMGVLLFNKLGTYIVNIFNNWLEFVSPPFLFTTGSEKAYLSVPGYGEFLLILSPFYIIGLVCLLGLKTNNKAKNLLVLYLWLISPIASALSGKPQIVRGSALLIPVAMIISLGIKNTLNYFKSLKLKRLFIIGLSMSLFYFGMQYYYDYFLIYPAQYDNAAYPLDKRLVNYLALNENKFDKIVIDSEFPDAYILLAFYQKINPQWLQQNIGRTEKDSFGFSHPISLGNYQFIDIGITDSWCESQAEKTLIIRRPQDTRTPRAVFYNFSHVHPQYKAYICPEEEDAFKTEYY